ncbi:PTS lactose/cellobiose transporter subunit IIA [Proteiniclasticum sp.]|uniref:PTS lactose/cellobiose transporter subunit IIA n=1 Tax=Proteiniclasticum sp. TaxID=2053595 RepID=UPI00289FEB07|nr:PTS lactose/cellobiose transporter subunit IIA [Proteiniclasticum sp.]
MNSSDQISFEMIAKNGAARSLFMEAVQAAKIGNTPEAIRLMEDGEAMLIEGHMIHAELVTEYARGEKIPMDLLLVHAEDQLMAAEMFKLMAKELIEIYGRLNQSEEYR